MISILPRSDAKIKWRVKPVFSIGLHIKDHLILQQISSTLGIGKIYSTEFKTYLRVESISELQCLINHFDLYPLVTAKIVDYFYFRKCFELIKTNQHLTEEGLHDIVKYKAHINKGLSDNLKEHFKVEDTQRKEFVFKGIPDPNWISGFVSGDGSFNIKTTATVLGKVQLRWAVTLHKREKQVIEGLAYFFKDLKDSKLGISSVENTSKNLQYRSTYVAIQIVNFSYITDVIIPFFEQYKIEGQKRLDFDDFKLVAEKVKKGEHLTDKGYKEIIDIKKGMNLNRVNRKVCDIE